jgi:hypothetical protein
MDHGTRTLIKMSAVKHYAALRLTNGLFSTYWFLQTSPWFDTLVPGKRMPAWELRVSLYSCTGCVLSVILAVLKLNTDWLLVEWLLQDVEITHLVLAGCLFNAVQQVVTIHLCFRAASILQAFYVGRLPLSVPYSIWWTWFWTSANLQLLLNRLEMMDPRFDELLQPAGVAPHEGCVPAAR